MLAEVEFSVAQNVTFFLLYHKQNVFAHNIIGDFMDFVKIIILSAVSFLVLFALSKFMGSRQISQLSFFDYVIGISIGSIAAEMATNIDLAWWKGVLAMIIYAALDVLFELLSRKSIKARKFINGTPIILINNSKISKSALKKAKIELDDLITAARSAGYFDLSQIDTAVMEITGKISFLPKPLERQLTPRDFNFAPVRKGLLTTVVIDGELLADNIASSAVTADYVTRVIAERELRVQDVFLATVDESGNVEIFEKE